MMTKNISDIFLYIIREKIPEKTKLATLLTHILGIEKEAVYRRLRGEVAFSFAEVAGISKELNISLDTIIGIDPYPQKTYPFYLKLNSYLHLSETDYTMHEEFIELLSSARNDPQSEMGFATGILPLHFSVKHELIQRFYTLRWLYQFEPPGSTQPFSHIIFPERVRKLFQRFLSEVEYFRKTFFIWDKLTLLYLINDVKYFHKIQLISEEEVKALKEEILNFLDDFEKLAIRGAFENGNEVSVYLSGLNFETTYSCIRTASCHLTMLKTFTLNETVSFDEMVYNKMKTWLHSLKRTSILISGSNEKDRILFFEGQRELVKKSFCPDSNLEEEIRGFL